MRVIRTRGVLAAVLLMYPASASGQVNETEAEKVKRTVEGINARAKALFSGRMEYNLVSGAPQGKPNNDYRATLSFSGTSWCLRRPATQGYHASHAGKEVYYWRSRQQDGRTTGNANVGPEVPINAKFPSPPVFAGTFWWENTTKFVRDNAAKAVLKGEQKVGDVETRVVEWSIGPEQTVAFGDLGRTTVNGGVLRVYAAQKYGYALPRIECVGPDGTVDIVYESTDFRDVGAGIYLPKTCSQKAYQQGNLTYRCEYTIHKTELINDAVPEEDFVIEFAPGTLVQDIRDPTKNVTFKVGDRPFTSDKLKNLPPSGGTSSIWRSWKGAVLAGMVGGLGLVGGSWAVRRRLAARRTPA